MIYKIIKGDRFLCLENYIMDDEKVAFKKGNIYLSELNGCITDDEFDINHGMEGEYDFFEFFKLII
jgi:hypothetical protein